MSSSPKAVASLTSTLLVAKGNPNASGFTTLTPLPPRGAARAAQRPAKEEGQQVSLHLDPTQLRRMRLAAAHLDQSEQAFILTALEYYIDHVVSPLLDGQCGCLETESKPRPSAHAIPFARQKSDLTQ